MLCSDGQEAIIQDLPNIVTTALLLSTMPEAFGQGIECQQYCSDNVWQIQEIICAQFNCCNLHFYESLQ